MLFLHCIDFVFVHSFHLFLRIHKSFVALSVLDVFVFYLLHEGIYPLLLLGKLVLNLDVILSSKLSDSRLQIFYLLLVLVPLGFLNEYLFRENDCKGFLFLL